MGAPLIDNLQDANWSETAFRRTRKGAIDAIHVTIAYYKIFAEIVRNITAWNRWVEHFPDFIVQGFTGDDMRKAQRDSRNFRNIGNGLGKVGFSQGEIDGIMGCNWLRSYDAGFGPETTT